ncbi:YceG family protein [Clostridium oryzae]|uniref:Putative component of 'biosynthetic module' domain-containing protein n=1 Tax=Clostridium oryzae TaxID=1450648 RepID=A0A1V4IYQ2_9CLOT|nr:YceG family protein [Clostridium oryzae]OPJ65029.1 hypothetical protein CLORY_00290 [Clostridium oryzae]
MEKNMLDKLDIQAVNTELTDDVLRDLKTPIKNRKGFKYDSYVVTIPRYFYRFIGISSTEDEYYDFLYKLDRDLKIFTRNYLRFDKGLDGNISITIQNKLNDIWNKINIEEISNSSLIIEQLDKLSLFPNMQNKSFGLQVKNYLKFMLDYYIKTVENVNNEKVKMVVSYCIYWLNIYAKNLFEGFNYEMINPKVLYYGDMTSEEAFFVTLLSSLGCDVLYYNPEKAGAIEQVDKFKVFSKEIEYIYKMPPKEFPKELKGRVKTSAFTAKEELDKTLYEAGGSFYRPWQFADYSVASVTMKTTYEEINIWAKEKAYVRDGWKAEANTVYIPNLFAKVSGTHEDVEKYYKELTDILNLKKTILIKELPFTDVTPLEYGKLEYVYPERGGEFDINKLINASWWKYKELRKGLQIAMAEKIRDLCINPVIYNVENEEIRDFQVDIFSVLINLKTNLLHLLQDFDYPDDIPKIIIYNNEQNGNISYEDSITLAFMNSMGTDIIIYNPSGYNDIEQYVYADSYDSHRLEKMSFNLPLKKYEEKKGFFKSLFHF